MKRLITAFVLFLPLVCIAQIPMGLNYQAIAWDKNNLPKANQTITVTINILKGPNASTDVEFTEIHTAKTNELGLFTLTIGSNNPQGFQQINWAAIPKYLHVIVDGNPSNPTPMLSVPYAMYAENTTLKAGSGIAVNGNTISNTGDGDSDPRNELQELSIEGDLLKLSKNGGEVPILTTLKAGSGISVSGNTISNTGDADSDPKNELQTLILDGNKIALNKGGGEVIIPTQNESILTNSGLMTISNTEPSKDLKNLYTIPEDAKYLIMFKISVASSSNIATSPKVSLTSSISGTIYENTLSLSKLGDAGNTEDIFDFELVLLKKGEKINFNISDSLSGTWFQLFRIKKLLIVRIE